MSDNTTLPGTGEVIASKEIGGAKYQSMVLADGVAGEAELAAVTSIDTVPGVSALAVNVVPSATEPRLAAVLEKIGGPGAQEAGPGDSGEARTIYDLLDPLGPNSVPLRTAPADISTPGQRPAIQSFPVVLANEQTFDQNIQAAWPPGAQTVGLNALDPAGRWIDVSQYRSISVQTRTEAGVTVTVLFEGSNDGLNPVPLPLFDAAAQNTAPVTTVAQVAATSRFWVGPLPFRWVRFRISVAVAGGNFSAYTRLSMAPFAPVVSQIAASTAGGVAVNIGQLAGTLPVTAGVAGTQAVGGNIAVGVAQTSNPLVVGGVDAGGLTRRVLTDALGNQAATGPDPRNFPLTLAPVPIASQRWDVLFSQILNELRTLNVAVALMANGQPVPETLGDDLMQLSDSATATQ